MGIDKKRTEKYWMPRLKHDTKIVSDRKLSFQSRGGGPGTLWQSLKGPLIHILVQMVAQRGQ